MSGQGDARYRGLARSWCPALAPTTASGLLLTCPPGQSPPSAATVWPCHVPDGTPTPQTGPWPPRAIPTAPLHHSLLLAPPSGTPALRGGCPQVPAPRYPPPGAGPQKWLPSRDHPQGTCPPGARPQDQLPWGLPPCQPAGPLFPSLADLKRRPSQTCAPLSSLCSLVAS